MESSQNEIIAVDVGARLRQLRMQRDKSMRALARLSGLSTNALSMIERGKTSPSVSTLYKIADALGVPITAFFRMEPPRHEIVFRKSTERTQLPFQRGLWEGLGGEVFIGAVEPFMLTLEAGATSGPYGMLHTGHEFVYCVKGEIDYEVEEHRFHLEANDTLLFAARLRHRWRNSGKDTAQAVILLSGFEGNERPSEHHISDALKEEEE